MYLEWWMLGTMFFVWFVSILSYGSTARKEGLISGAGSILADLDDKGYIRIKDDGGIIGLCNKDEEN